MPAPLNQKSQALDKSGLRELTPDGDETEPKLSEAHLNPTKPWRDEFQGYLDARESVPEGMMTIEWWGCRLKHAFSSAGITISKYRNQLKRDLVEALQVLKCFMCHEEDWGPEEDSNKDKMGWGRFLDDVVENYESDCQNILKKFRFDIPAGIENNPADYAKVVAAGQGAFTQLHPKFKRALCTSLKANKTDKTNAPGPEHQNIFKLTQIFLDGSQCTVTIKLCVHFALMVQSELSKQHPKRIRTVVCTDCFRMYFRISTLTGPRTTSGTSVLITAVNTMARIDSRRGQAAHLLQAAASYAVHCYHARQSHQPYINHLRVLGASPATLATLARLTSGVILHSPPAPRA
ncbi:hypothetical protein B0H14DRAFT_2632470 [Mycena olivaceomarginata]|nr:hypothetical protein B0H14DRAFT_2632470 [Mycena olivaceomarginata]